MNIKDLRVGNLVIIEQMVAVVITINYHNNRIGTKSLGYEIHNVDRPQEEIQPIPMEQKYSSGFNYGGKSICHVKADGSVWIDQNRSGSNKLGHIEYLHQYQNLFYILTFKELELFSETFGLSRAH